MNRTTIISLFLAAIASVEASATDVNSARPGSLAEAIGADTTAVSLKVTGSINASDFAFIADKMTHLRQLDLSGCAIAAYSGAELPFSGLRRADQAQLPPYSFIGMKNLESVVLPQKLKSIGSGAFTGSGVTSVTVPEGVTAIGDYAFMRCDLLATVALPASLTRFGKSVFANCTSLRTVVFAPDNLLATLPEGTFEGCTSLSQLNLEALAGCTEIGPWSLAHCNSLSNVIIPPAVKTISSGALFEDSAIRSLTLNDEIEDFDQYALAGLRHVTKLSIPESVTFFATGAMAGWDALTEFDVSALNSIPGLGDDVWGEIDPSSVTLVVADDLADNFRNAPQWQDFRIVRQSDHVSTTDIDAGMSDKTYIAVTVNGNILTVKSENTGLGIVSIFNTSGIRIISTDAGKKNLAEIDINALPGGAYLIVTSVGVAKIVLL